MPSDDVMTPEEQAALDADRAAEVADNQDQTTPPPSDDAVDPAAGDAADPVATDGQPPGEHRTVPLATFMEEKKQRQETERRLTDAERRSATLEERTNIMLQRFAAPEQQPAPPPSAPAIPTFEEDPAGNILGQVRQQGAIIGELVQVILGQNRQSEAAAGVQQLTMRAAAAERDFAAANPDYDKASSHLFEMRRQELVAAGWTDPAEIQHMMANEATGLAARALQQGRNPAEIVYQLAKLRGYAGAAPTPPVNGSAEGQLRTIAAGQQQSRSSGSRGSGPAPLTAQKLAEMSDAEFSKMMDTPEGKALMGV